MGRKRVFVLGLVGFAIGYAALAFGIQIGQWAWLATTPLFLLLLGARMVYGVMAGGIQPAATAYIADVTDESSRAQGMALIGMAGGIGTILGPAFGGLLATLGAVVPMYAASALALSAAAIAGLRLAEPPRHASLGGGARVKPTDARVFPYLLGWFVVFLVFTAVQVVTAFFIEDRLGVTEQAAVIRVASVALLSMALVTVVIQAVVLQIWKISPRVLLRVAFLLFGIDLLLLAFAESLIVLYLTYGGMGLTFGLAAPGLSAAASLSVEAEEQGAIAGLLAAAPTLGMVFGPALGGAIYKLAPSLPMLGGAIAAVALGVYFQFVRVPDPAPASEAGLH